MNTLEPTPLRRQMEVVWDYDTNRLVEAVEKQIEAWEEHHERNALSET